jgi:hypothetical protein
MNYAMNKNDLHKTKSKYYFFFIVFFSVFLFIAMSVKFPSLISDTIFVTMTPQEKIFLRGADYYNPYKTKDPPKTGPPYLCKTGPPYHCETGPPNTCPLVRYGCEKDYFSLWGSLIYWQPRQAYMDVALESCCPDVINNCCGSSWNGSKRVSMEPGYKPGFKVGAAFTHKDWGSFLDFTFYEFKDSLSRTVHKDGFLFARWIQPGIVTDNAVNHLHTSWKLRMYTWNAGMGKKFPWGRHLNLQPHFGVSVAHIDQSFKGNFSLIDPINLLKVFNKSDSWGVGPRAGVAWDWKWTRRWGIVGNVAAELLYTHYDLDLHQWSPTDSTLFIRISDDIEALRAEFEMYAGLDYRFLISKHAQMHFIAGYDFQLWWNQNMIRWNNDTSYQAIPEGNLYLQGFRFTLGIDF